MPKTSQVRKHTTGLAGEFLVAGELLRREVMAAVTYGNAKKADVIAFSEGRSIALEVKSTSGSKWVLGGLLPTDCPKLYVLVYLPSEATQAPEYYVVTSAELRKAVQPAYDSYMARYEAKHGKKYSGVGVVSVRQKDIAAHRGAWEKVHRALGDVTLKEAAEHRAAPDRRGDVVSAGG